jgi:hypothetical protein
MDPLSWIAILVGVGTGVIANMAWAAMRATWSLFPIRSDPVRKSIVGEWRGQFKQAGSDGKEEAYSLTLKLKAGRKTVTGTGTYTSEGQDTAVDIQGGFVDSRRLVLRYKNSDPAKLQHGEIILSLSNDAMKLDGAFVGLGVVTNKIGSGSVGLTKAA